ncbi:MAG: hypothetical protein CMF74_15405 [Maricaulis sp.]|nr:hypothetical protein [Maricaulis sp.]
MSTSECKVNWSMHDPETEPDVSLADLERLFAAMSPPQTLSNALEKQPVIRATFASQNCERLVGALAGLSTEPRLQANITRIDWAIRFALAFSRGRKSLRSKTISDILNRAFDAARISVLEDPVESPFIERLATSRGDRLIIGGLWESAGFYSECTLRAFEALPEHDIKTAALDRSYALLRLSHEIALRTGYPPNVPGGGEPSGAVRVPNEAKLRTLAKRVRFTFDDLERMGIDRDDLLPFVLREEATAHLIDSEIGNSPLEFLPLMPVGDGLIVTAPQNLTTAMRADLITTAIDSGMKEGFQRALLFTQSDALKSTHFLGNFPAQYRDNGELPRLEILSAMPSGYWMHLVQLIDGFDDWPEQAFASTTTLGETQVQTLRKSVTSTREWCEKQPGFIEGITVVLPCGVGRGFSLIQEAEDERESWASLFISASDALTIGLVEHGEFNDVWRLVKLADLTEAMGFQVFSANGWLNTFQWWKDNKFKLVPENQLDLAPPSLINFDTNLLLRTRLEAIKAADYRTLMHPTKGIRPVFRMSRSPRGADYDVLYADIEAIDILVPRAAARVGATVWWIELETSEYGKRVPDEIFRTWDGLTHWAAKCLKHVSEQFQLGEDQIEIVLTIAPSPPPPVRSADAISIEETVSLRCDPDGRSCKIELSADWHRFLFRPDNLAERHVAARFIEAYFRLIGIGTDGVDFDQLALSAVGSPNYRWRHIIEAKTPVEHIKHSGLAGEFREISPSAGTLVQFSSCWKVRAREDGPRIEGRDDCLRFASQYYGHLLDTLITRARGYDREAILGYALAALQSAEGELSHWSATASAMRAIHGVEGDQELSMERRSEAYGVIRSSSIILEIAHSEAGKDGDRIPGHLDFEELQALALMVFEVADLNAGIAYNQIESRIHISPTGELLSNHEFEERTLQVSGQQINLRNRLTDAERYIARFQEKETSEPEATFSRAVEAEFGTPWEGVVDLSIASAHVADERREGILKLRKSELVAELAKFEPLKGVDLAPAIDRLSMIRRPSWLERPNDWTPNDIDLGRLGRRFAPISRPIVPLDEDDDPLLLISPAAIFRSVMFSLGGAMDGSLQNEYWLSREMRHYSSNAGRLAGNRFNQRVADALSALGLEAQAEVKPSACLNVKATPEVKKLGDIDSLAIDRVANTVWIVEAKDLQVCRTLGEAARRLSDYRGLIDGRGQRDKLRRHLDRVSFIRANAHLLCKRLGLTSTPTVKGLVIVRAPQPFADMAVTVGEDARSVMFEELEDFFGR